MANWWFWRKSVARLEGALIKGCHEVIRPSLPTSFWFSMKAMSHVSSPVLNWNQSECATWNANNGFALLCVSSKKIREIGCHVHKEGFFCILLRLKAPSPCRIGELKLSTMNPPLCASAYIAMFCWCCQSQNQAPKIWNHLRSSFCHIHPYPPPAFKFLVHNTYNTLFLNY